MQSSQNQKNQLITTLISAQQGQNVLNAQHNATSNSFVNIRPPEPIQRASDARGKARQPNDFNGSPDENAENWIREIQMYLELSNENPNQWVKLAAAYLQKDASLWWNAYSNSVLLQNYSTIKWEEFVEAFLKRFRSIANEEHAISKLQKWKHNGNLELYIRGFTNIQTLIPYP